MKENKLSNTYGSETMVMREVQISDNRLDKSCEDRATEIEKSGRPNNEDGKLIWIEEFIKENRINKSFSLRLPFSFSISATYIRKIEQEYIPAEERGGIFLCKPNINEKKLEVIDVIYVTNRSEYKSESYEPDEEQKLEVINYAFTNQLIPILFHTHSTYGRTSEFIKKLDTSPDGDQCIYSHYNLCGFNIYLPDSLIVCNRDYNLIFIGLYGGKTIPPLPLDFETQKNNNIRKSLEGMVRIMRYLEKVNIWVKILLIFTIGYTFFKYPREVVSFLLSTFHILPLYSFEEIPKQFKLDFTNTNKIELLLSPLEKESNIQYNGKSDQLNNIEEIDENKINIGICIDKDTVTILIILIILAMVIYFGMKR